jgi:hypothetical protein
VALTTSGTASAAATATLTRLSAASLHAKHGITVGGQSFGRTTTTGTLTGRSGTTLLAPTRGRYVVTLPAGSAALLTL